MREDLMKSLLVVVSFGCFTGLSCADNPETKPGESECGRLCRPLDGGTDGGAGADAGARTDAGADAGAITGAVPTKVASRTLTTQGANFDPRVASLPSGFLVVWMHESQNVVSVRLAILGPDLSPVGETKTLDLDAQTSVSKQLGGLWPGSGGRFLLTWWSIVSGTGTHSNPVLKGVVLDNDGTMVATSFMIAARPVADNSSLTHSAAFDGSRWLVAVAGGGAVTTGDDLGSVFVSTTGEVSSGPALAAGAGAQWAPSLCFANNHYLLTWQDTRANPNGAWNEIDIYARLLDSSGRAAGDEIKIALAPSFDGAPKALCNAAPFGVAWHHFDRNESVLNIRPLNADGGRTVSSFPLTASLTSAMGGRHVVASWYAPSSDDPSIDDLVLQVVSEQGESLPRPVVVDPRKYLRRNLVDVGPKNEVAVAFSGEARSFVVVYPTSTVPGALPVEIKAALYSLDQ